MDRTDDFQKFCGSRLDRIQFHGIRTGLGLKNFTVRSSLYCGSLMLSVFCANDSSIEQVCPSLASTLCKEAMLPT